MPGLVPYRPDNPASEANRAAWATLAASPTPMLVAFGDSDPITGAMGPILIRTMAGAQGREHPTIADAGHFLQEDAGSRARPRRRRLRPRHLTVRRDAGPADAGRRGPAANLGAWTICPAR